MAKKVKEKDFCVVRMKKKRLTLKKYSHIEKNNKKEFSTRNANKIFAWCVHGVLLKNECGC